MDLCTGDLFLQLELFLAELGFHLEGIVRRERGGAWEVELQSWEEPPSLF